MQIRVDETNGLRIIDDDGRTLLDNIGVRLEYPGELYNRLWLSASGIWSLSQRGEVTVAQCDNAVLECRREGDGGSRGADVPDHAQAGMKTNRKTWLGLERPRSENDRINDALPTARSHLQPQSPL